MRPSKNKTLWHCIYIARSNYAFFLHVRPSWRLIVPLSYSNLIQCVPPHPHPPPPHCFSGITPLLRQGTYFDLPFSYASAALSSPAPSSPVPDVVVLPVAPALLHIPPASSAVEPEVKQKWKP